jgi:hypothetical protein
MSPFDVKDLRNKQQATSNKQQATSNKQQATSNKPFCAGICAATGKHG